MINTTITQKKYIPGHSNYQGVKKLVLIPMYLHVEKQVQ